MTGLWQRLAVALQIEIGSPSAQREGQKEDAHNARVQKPGRAPPRPEACDRPVAMPDLGDGCACAPGVRRRD